MNRFYQSLAALMLLLATGGMSPLWGQTTLINPSTDGGFELGSTLADNGWVAVNGAQTNKWFVGGVATSFAGANSAYISSNTTGTTYDYDVNSASGVSFYKDITIPAGESKLQISFRWKSAGETCCD
ncbi:MAG TPA: hypothetical protein PK637_17245, partial [Flavobacteriales bacterium]|nr:hypothetical protein [Flavobacteriales bacterium]